MLSLQNLGNGQRARIESLSGRHEEIARLCELGLCSGAVLTVIRRGSPCIVELNGGKLCLRTSADTSIRVATDSV